MSGPARAEGAARPSPGDEVGAQPHDLQHVAQAFDHASDADVQPGASAAEAIDRATAAVGHDDGKR